MHFYKGLFALAFTSVLAQCLKITEKVSFNIASEASYVYILSGQKCQKWSILASFGKTKAYGQTVLPDRSVLKGQKLVENAKIQMWVNYKCIALLQYFLTVLMPLARLLAYLCSQASNNLS